MAAETKSRLGLLQETDTKDNGEVPPTVQGEGESWSRGRGGNEDRTHWWRTVGTGDGTGVRIK